MNVSVLTKHKGDKESDYVSRPGPVLYTGYSPSRVTRTPHYGKTLRQWGEVVRDVWRRVSGNLTKRPNRGNPGNPLFLHLKRPLHTL